MLSEKQLDDAAALVVARASIAMRPFNEIDADQARADLDRAFLGDVLGLPASLFDAGGPLDLLRRKLAAEPSITGLKKRLA